MEIRSSVGILFDLRELSMADDLGRDSPTVTGRCTERRCTFNWAGFDHALGASSGEHVPTEEPEGKDTGSPIKSGMTEGKKKRAKKSSASWPALT